MYRETPVEILKSGGIKEFDGLSAGQHESRIAKYGPTTIRSLSMAAIIILAAFPVSCAQQYEKGSRFDYQDRVGFTRISVVAVTPWSRIAPILATHFELTPEQALQKAAQSGRTLDEEITSNLAAKVTGTFGPSASVLGNRGAGGGSSPATASAETNTGVSVKPTSPADQSHAGPIKAAPSDNTKETSKAAPVVGSHPALSISAPQQYQAAMALYQQVNLLSTYIDNIANYAPKATPYLVTMDIAIVPYTPHAEVNALVIVSFLVLDADGKLQTVPAVVPVMASEDIETGAHSRSAHNSVALALDLNSLAGGSGNVSHTHDALSKIIGTDVNSLQLVSSANTNSLVIRFGASYGTKTEYALYPQMRRVHCLVWVPQGFAGGLYALANASFQYTEPRSPNWDALVGLFGIENDSTRIPVRSNSDLLKKMTAKVNDETGYNFTQSEVDRIWRSYTLSSFKKEYGGFQGTVSAMGHDEAGPLLWAEMTQISLASGWGYSGIPLPTPVAGPQAKVYLGMDDGEFVAITIPAGEVPAESGCWNMMVTAASQPAALLPSSIEPEMDQRMLTIRFKTLKTAEVKRPGFYNAVLSYVPGCDTKNPGGGSEEATINVLIATGIKTPVGPKAKGGIEATRTPPRSTPTESKGKTAGSGSSATPTASRARAGQGKPE